MALVADFPGIRRSGGLRTCVPSRSPIKRYSARRPFIISNHIRQADTELDRVGHRRTVKQLLPDRSTDGASVTSLSYDDEDDRTIMLWLAFATIACNTFVILGDPFCA